MHRLSIRTIAAYGNSKRTAACVTKCTRDDTEAIMAISFWVHGSKVKVAALTSGYCNCTC